MITIASHVKLGEADHIIVSIISGFFHSLKCHVTAVRMDHSSEQYVFTCSYIKSHEMG